MGREDNPFGADGGEIAEELAVAFIDGLFVQACVVDEFRDNEIGLDSEDRFIVVMDLACGLSELTGRVVATPRFRDEFDLRFRE